MPVKYQDLIDDYLRGKLSEEQRREVERLVDTDEDFRNELNFHQQTKSAFAQLQHEHLKQRLHTLKENKVMPLPAEKISKTRKLSVWLVACSVLLFCAIGAYLWKQQGTNPKELYMAYFEPYPNVVLPVTRDQVQQAERTLAYSYYEQREYPKAYQLFKNLPEEELNADPEILFYSGVSAMQLHLDDEAIALFRQYQGAGKVRLERQAKWYEALTHLKQGNKAEMQNLLQELAEHQGYKNEEAADLLKQF
jgi:hypothetical protein